MVIAKIDVQKGASTSKSAYVSLYKISYSEEAWRVIWKEYMEHSVVGVSLLYNFFVGGAAGGRGHR